MKKVLLLALMGLFGLAVVTACHKKDKENRLLGGNDTVDIHVRHNGTRAENPKLLTPKEICKKLWVFKAQTIDNGKDTVNTSNLHFSKNQRDTVNGILKVWASSIITPTTPDGLKTGHVRLIDGNDSFLSYVNLMGIDSTGKTICYIPNKQLRENADKIRQLFKEKKYNEVYELFQKAYTAYPIDSIGYDKLVKEHKQ